MKRKRNSLTEKDINKIISLDLDGKTSYEIGQSINASSATVTQILNYYRGKNNKAANTLSSHYKSIVDKLEDRQLPSSAKYPTYEISLFFGLIKIDVKPKTN